MHFSKLTLPVGGGWKSEFEGRIHYAVTAELSQRCRNRVFSSRDLRGTRKDVKGRWQEIRTGWGVEETRIRTNNGGVVPLPETANWAVR